MSKALRALALAFYISLSAGAATADEECRTNTPGWIDRDGGHTAAAYFAAVKTARQFTHGKPRVIGGSKCGCFAGGRNLPAEMTDAKAGSWQVIQPWLNRSWGHPLLMDYLADLAKSARHQDVGGLLIGDLSQPAGGPMTGGHASHQLGLDADIWFSPMPQRRLTNAERIRPFKSRLLRSMLMRPRGQPLQVNPNTFTWKQIALLKTAALDARVRSIFVHPLLKRHLCDRYAPTGHPQWLRVLRPEAGHDAHFHVRLKCPEDDADACHQPANSFGVDCGAGLDAKVRSLSESGFDGDGQAREIQRSIRLFPLACQRLIRFSR
jgi:penicillin-insensitive murein DD-endopeptidase